MTFARLAKLLAVLLVGLALWRMREPAPPAHVVVLALPGAAADVVAPTGGELRTGEIRSTSVSTGGAWWRRLFGRGDEPGSGPLWGGEDPAVRPLAVPAGLLPDPDQAEAVERQFVGSSSGAVVESVDITSGRLPAPYDRAIDAVAAAAANLSREQWSEWITTTPGPADEASAGAEFQFAHYTDTSYFFTPAYRIGDPRIVGTPFLRRLDRPLRPLVATHVIELARRRLAPARQLFRDSGDGKAVIAFHGAVEAVTNVFAPDSVPALVLERAGNAIAADLAVLREAVGEHGLVLVIGGPPSTRQPVGSPWYRLVEGGKSGRGAQTPPVTPIEFEQARALVRYATGVALDATEKALVPADLAARFPIVPTVRGSGRGSGDQEPVEPWSPEAIESVPGAVD